MSNFFWWFFHVFGVKTGFFRAVHIFKCEFTTYLKVFYCRTGYLDWDYVITFPPFLDFLNGLVGKTCEIDLHHGLTVNIYRHVIGML